MNKLYWKIISFFSVMVFFVVAFITFFVAYFTNLSSGGSNFPNSDVPNIKKANQAFIKNSLAYYNKNIESTLDFIYTNYLQNGYEIDLKPFIPAYVPVEVVDKWWTSNFSIFGKIPIVAKHFSFTDNNHNLDNARIHFLDYPKTQVYNPTFDSDWTLSDLVWTYIDLIDKKYYLPELNISLALIPIININDKIREAITNILDSLKKQFNSLSYIPQFIKSKINPYFDLNKIDSVMENLWVQLGGQESQGQSHDPAPPSPVPDPNNLNYSVRIGFNYLSEGSSEPEWKDLNNSILAAINNFIFDTYWTKSNSQGLEVQNLIDIPLPNNLGIQILDPKGDPWPSNLTISATLINTILHNYFQITNSFDWRNNQILNSHWGFIIK